MQKLFEIGIVPRIKGTENLYFRKTESGISYDTFFNMIPLKKIRRYTTITGLSFDKNVNIYSENGFIKSGASVLISELPDNEVIYLKDNSKNPQKISVYAYGNVNTIKVCIVICTYKREQQVTENIRYLLENLDIDHHIVLVDNASEIEFDYFNDSRVSVLHNVNNGGSGGFGKGMRIAVEMNCFTHLILMDDDVVADRIAIEKTVGFLRFLKAEYADLCISGAMIYRDKPMIQFESGGYFSKKGIQIGYGYHYDISKFEKLLENEREKNINYGGWWLFSMPIRYAESGNYPVSFFVKYDDVEYALRCRQNIVTLNGVGVWHENFGSKYNSVQEYFNTRNYLFLRKWHTPDFDEKTAYKTARYLLLEKLCRQQYKMAEAVLIAYKDFLKGENYLETVNYTERLQQLSKLNYTMLSDEELQRRFGVQFDPQNICQRTFKWYMQPLLYGQLVPDFLCRKLTITDVISDRKEHYFGASHVLHYDKARHCGYGTRKNILAFIKCLNYLRKIRGRVK